MNQVMKHKTNKHLIEILLKDLKGIQSEGSYYLVNLTVFKVYTFKPVVMTHYTILIYTFITFSGKEFQNTG